ncbi:MAG: ATP-binding protein [Granulosicoccus sp.]
MRNLSITSRMLLVAFVPALLVAFLMALYSVVTGVRDSEQSELQRAVTLAQGLANASEFALVTANTQLLDELAQPLLAIPSIQIVCFYDAENALLHEAHAVNQQEQRVGAVASKLRQWVSQQPMVNRVSAPVQRTDLTQFQDPLFDKRSSTEPLAPSHTISGEKVGRILFKLDLTLAYQNQLVIVRRGLMYVTVVLLLAMGAAYSLARSVINPIRTLTHSVKALAANEYVKIPAVSVGGELDELAVGVNYLSSELQAFHARQTQAIQLATEDLQSTLSLLEQKNTELEQARESAETASAFKSQFVANMSHEIRTPLNAIIGTLSVMNKSGLDITQLDQFTMISNSSKTLLYLIEDILDISKIESGNLVVESISTNLESLLDEVHTTVAMQAVDRGVEFFVTPLPDLSLREVYTDPTRLKQVLLNLVSNSIKFTHEGHVLLSTELIEHESGLRVVKFTVKDTGIGIPVEKQKLLFSAFTQVDMSTTRRYGGTGLGLFICSGIVELLDGTIELSSEAGSGTCIEVVIPLQVARTASIQPVEPAPEDSGVIYRDSYAPLQPLVKQYVEKNLATLKTDTNPASSVYIQNIPNRMLGRSWVGPIVPSSESDKKDKHLPELHDYEKRIALVSQLTPSIQKRLQQAGFTGYALKTPSSIAFKRSLQRALSDQPFGVSASAITNDDRPEKTDRVLTVLAVDDQRINIDLLMQFFDYLEIRGIYASSGKEALAYVETEEIDLVLLDLHMPDQDGFEIAEAIRNSAGANAQVPVVAMTADAYSSTRKRAMAVGFDDLLTKPATVQAVRDAIARWTRSTENPRPQTSPMVDLQACADAVSGNITWARTALKTYGDEAPQHISALHTGLEKNDKKHLFETAHAVKGVSRLFRINPVSDAAESLEEACNSEDWQEIKNRAYLLETLLLKAAGECANIAAPIPAEEEHSS